MIYSGAEEINNILVSASLGSQRARPRKMRREQRRESLIDGAGPTSFNVCAGCRRPKARRNGAKVDGDQSVGDLHPSRGMVARFVPAAHLAIDACAD